jgi:hypothetical protein
VTAVADASARYLALVEAAAAPAAKALRSHGDLSRAGSAEAFAAAATLIPVALARHRRKRGGAIGAVLDVLSKYGAPAALTDPRAHLAPPAGAPAPTARLGGLLGDDGARLATFLSSRTRDPDAVLSRALGSAAPLVLAALSKVAAPDMGAALGTWLGELDEADLSDPARLLSGPSSDTFRRVRGRASPWWKRVLP